VIQHPAYEVEPWAIREKSLELDVLAQSESVFTLANGHIGWRGNLDEGEPFGIPGSYLNSVYETRPLPYAEAGYGYPEAGQSVINVTNGKVLRLLVDDEPFDVRYGTLEQHERVLDLRAGTLHRMARWRSPAACGIEVHSTRLVSLTHRAVAAVYYEVRPVDAPVRVVVQSELVANEPVPGQSRDPRSAAVLESPLQLEENATFGRGGIMIHRTKLSGLRVAAAMDHIVEGPENMVVESSGGDDVCRLTVAASLEIGSSLQITKMVGYGWSSRRSRPALHDQVAAAIASARQTGWQGLLDGQRSFLDEFWEGADVEVDGDPEVQQAVRFGLFHVLQSGARAEQRPIPAKGLTGPGYDGHTFWDSETYVLPVFTFTYPTAAADALAWRQSTLPQAKDRASSLGLKGASYPWRTISGDECSSYWPAGTAAFHINADIADAVIRYVDATDDRDFERATAFPILVGTARLWRSLGHHDMSGRFRIDGVTGPDEYSAIADNNVYTNLMAQRNLRVAANLAGRYVDDARELGVSDEESASWRDAAEAMFIPYDARLGVHPQSEGFTDHAVWDFDATGPDQYPLLLHFPYFDLYRKQVVKQADLVLAMYLRGDAFTPEEKARNFAYYEALTVRDSSLSACIQASVAAEVGQLELAYNYLSEAALMDLDDLEHNTSDGLHIASLAGAWTALVTGFGGMRATDGELMFRPRLPAGLERIRFRVRYRGRLLRVEIRAALAIYTLVNGEPITLRHYDDTFSLAEKPVTRPIPALTPGPRPRQPKGREPLARHPGHLSGS
jgi:alpha,alpha-trehalose phosphorylase